MLKTILIIVAVVLIGVAIYFGRFLFTTRVVNEELPDKMSSASEISVRGNFRDIDFFHKGSGQAKILQDENGDRLLRFENFKVTNGPDLNVYVTKNPEPTDLNSLGEFINLGRLKGTEGNQNYDFKEIPEEYKTVVIWCQQFNTLFTFAILQ